MFKITVTTILLCNGSVLKRKGTFCFYAYMNTGGALTHALLSWTTPLWNEEVVGRKTP